jgi:Lamin Tail Domain
MNDISRRVLATFGATGFFALLFLAGFAGGVTLYSSLVSAQAAQVAVTELQCSSDPELVAVTNQSSSAQDLTGWSLKSDPVATETYDLTPVGVLGPGVTVFVESGPTASGTLVWSQNFVFRDSDASDFVQIVDNTGAVVTQVNCQGTSPSPTAAPTTAATAVPTTAPTRAAPTAPTPAPADVVPLGGGPPAPTSVSFLVFMVAAGLLAVGGGAVVVLTTAPAGARTSVAGFGVRSSRWPPSGRPAGESRLLYLLLLGVLALAAHLVKSRRSH